MVSSGESSDWGSGSGDWVSFVEWTHEETKLFEMALAAHFHEDDRWIKVAACMPGRTPQEVQSYWLTLEDELRRIESGLVPLPEYAASPSLGGSPVPMTGSVPKSRHRSEELGPSSKTASPAAKRQKTSADAAANGANPADRRKGVPWTEEEHRLFLQGLAKFGKGDWRSIARNFVVSRTPTQVASHAQKYFIRLNSANKRDKRRASIHDITHVQTAV